MPYPVDSIRAQFPVLVRNSSGDKPLAFLDSTATTQKPECMMEAMDKFYREHYSSVKRGVYKLSEQTTQAYEATRRNVAKFLNAASENEIVFTRGTTESINLVAWSYGRKFFKPGDEILISALEHHANIVPWQLIAEERGATIQVIPVDDNGDLILSEIPRLLKPGITKMLAITHISNSIGTENPIAEIIRTVRELSPETKILIDAAQSAPHLKIDVQALDCDFLAFSGHKMYGPTGIGCLYAKYAILDAMPPWHGGGEMIQQVTFHHTTYAAPPARFEAGTPPIAEVIGLGAALNWIQQIGIQEIHQHEMEMLDYALKQLEQVEGLHILGKPAKRGALLSFTLDAAHPHDAAMILDEENIAVRSGHHCAQPVMDRFHVPATIRASFGAYSMSWEIDRLVQGLERVVKIFG
jgi:cysteine desulfurase / selenocysteine lyase